MNDADTIQNDVNIADGRRSEGVPPGSEPSVSDRRKQQVGRGKVPVDFFVSYSQADRDWAAGIADWLKGAGYGVVLQSQDFVAGTNFISEMNAALLRTKRVIAVLSPDYFAASFPESEWTAAFARDPIGTGRSLIPVRVRECEIPPLLKPLVYIDLVGMAVDSARDRLLSEIRAALATAGTPRPRRTARDNVVPFPQPSHPAIHQAIRGNGNVQSVNVFARPPVIKTVVERREGSLTSEECLQVHAWIEDLAEGMTGMSRRQAYKKWWGHFKSAFHVEKYEALPSAHMGDAEKWYRMQRAMQTRGLKSRAPDVWRRKRIVAIKAAMSARGVAKQAYYPEVARRLRMRKSFASLNDLTKQDLDRVYTMALRDRDIR